MARTDVQIGQRYRAVGTSFLGSPTGVWVVGDIFTSTDSLRYARLVNVPDPTLKKTLAIEVLGDRRRFVLEATQ
ncbi:MAG: hypothetical protein JWL84_5409 [Rhodospirillales bacterium]|nr:hypothetical protein [Rhodospirillales bacterium]